MTRPSEVIGLLLGALSVQYPDCKIVPLIIDKDGVFHDPTGAHRDLFPGYKEDGGVFTFAHHNIATFYRVQDGFSYTLPEGETLVFLPPQENQRDDVVHAHIRSYLENHIEKYILAYRAVKKANIDPLT
jgi:hypothetical protein